MIIEAFDDMIQKCAITPNEHIFLGKQEHKHSLKTSLNWLGMWPTVSSVYLHLYSYQIFKIQSLPK